MASAEVNETSHFFEAMDVIARRAEDEEVKDLSVADLVSDIESLTDLVNSDDPAFLKIIHEVKTILPYERIDKCMDGLIYIITELRLNRSLESWCDNPDTAIEYALKFDTIRLVLRHLVLQFSTGEASKSQSFATDFPVTVKEKSWIVTDDMAGILYLMVNKYCLVVNQESLDNDGIGIRLDQLKKKIRRNVITEVTLETFSDGKVCPGLWRRADRMGSLEMALEASSSKYCPRCKTTELKISEAFGVVDCCDHYYCLACLRESYFEIIQW